MNVLETYTREEVVAHMLRTLGITAHQLGWEYLNIAINLSIEDAGYLRSITKRLYPTVAERTGSTPQRVERAIRHSIEDTFDRAYTGSMMRQVFESLVDADRYPCASLFIATLVELYNKEKHHPIFNIGGITVEQ